MCSPQSFSASFRPGVYPRLSWPPFGLVLNHHLVGNPDVDTLLPCKYGFGEIPHFASIEQDSLDHGFVKHCCNPWCNALRAKDLYYVGPGTPSFLQLVVYPSNIVILLSQESFKVFQYLEALQNLPMNREVVVQRQRQIHCQLSLPDPVHPGLALLSGRAWCTLGWLTCHIFHTDQTTCLCWVLNPYPSNGGRKRGDASSIRLWARPHTPGRDTAIIHMLTQYRGIQVRDVRLILFILWVLQLFWVPFCLLTATVDCADCWVLELQENIWCFSQHFNICCMSQNNLNPIISASAPEEV